MTLLKKTDYNTKITEIEGKITTNDVLTKVTGNKISNIETDLDGFKKSDLSNYEKRSEFTIFKGSFNILHSTVDDIEKDYLKRSALDPYETTKIFNKQVTELENKIPNVTVYAKKY